MQREEDGGLAGACVREVGAGSAVKPGAARMPAAEHRARGESDRGLAAGQAAEPAERGEEGGESAVTDLSPCDLPLTSPPIDLSLCYPEPDMSHLPPYFYINDPWLLPAD